MKECAVMKKSVLLSFILSMLILASCTNEAAPEVSESAVPSQSSVLESEAPSEPSASESEASQTEAPDASVNAEDAVGGLTDMQKADIAYAREKLDRMAISRSSLIELLHNEGFGIPDAEFAADHCDADWNQEALEAAEDIVEQGIKAEKEYLLLHLTDAHGFTEEEANYGADTYLAGK